MASHRHRGGGFPLGRVFVAVIALHIVVGSGAYWLAKTQAGQEFARVYHIKLFEPPKPETKPEPPPPPPPPQDVAKPKETPQTQAPTALAKLAPSAAPTIGGGGGGMNWSGKYSGQNLLNGPEGAFHAAVTGRFRKYYSEPPDSFGPAELELSVSGTGAVRSFRLVKSSGNAKNDQAILDAASHVQSEGVGVAPPENHARLVTVRFVPSS